MSKHMIYEIKNSKQVARILIPSRNAILKEILEDAYLLEVLENVNAQEKETEETN